MTITLQEKMTTTKINNSKSVARYNYVVAYYVPPIYMCLLSSIIIPSTILTSYIYFNVMSSPMTSVQCYTVSINIHKEGRS